MLEVSICIGSSCHLKGSYNIIQQFQQLLEEHSLHNSIELKGSFCMKQCNCDGVAVTIGSEIYHIKPEAAIEFFKTTVLSLV